MSEITPLNANKINDFKDRMIYYTTYKKGPLLQCLHFEHSGGFEAAVNDVKSYLTNKSLKHIHTVPFLIDIKAPLPSEES